MVLHLIWGRETGNGLDLAGCFRKNIVEAMFQERVERRVCGEGIDVRQGLLDSECITRYIRTRMSW